MLLKALSQNVRSITLSERCLFPNWLLLLHSLQIDQLEWCLLPRQEAVSLLLVWLGQVSLQCGCRHLKLFHTRGLVGFGPQYQVDPVLGTMEIRQLLLHYILHLLPLKLYEVSLIDGV